jgi:hypothetical protein
MIKMTLEHIQKQVSEYYSTLLDNEKEIIEHMPECDCVKLDHIKRMCCQIVTMDDREKAMRWLCFIQCFLWMNEIYTIDQMRQHNRQ